MCLQIYDEDGSAAISKEEFWKVSNNLRLRDSKWTREMSDAQVTSPHAHAASCATGMQLNHAVLRWEIECARFGFCAQVDTMDLDGDGNTLI